MAYIFDCKSAQDTECERRAMPVAVDRGGCTAVPVDQQAHLGAPSYAYTYRWARRKTVKMHASIWKEISGAVTMHSRYYSTLTVVASPAPHAMNQLRPAQTITNSCNRLATSHPPQDSPSCCEMRRTASSMPSQSANILVTARARKGGSNAMSRTSQCDRNSGRLEPNGPTQ